MKYVASEDENTPPLSPTETKTVMNNNNKGESYTYQSHQQKQNRSTKRRENIKQQQ